MIPVPDKIKDLLVYKILRVIYRWSINFFLQPFISLARELKKTTKTHFFEKRLGIETDRSSVITKDITMFKDSHRYEPTPYDVIEQMFEYIQFSKDDVFVDLGCGKGRVVCLAATKNLKKVIGVEAREDMADVARQNLRNLKLKKTPLEIVQSDVATFDMSDGTVFFMYAPFGKNTQLKVMENIKNSIAVKPRNIRIVCYGGPDLNTIDGCEWLTYEGRPVGHSLNIWSYNLIKK